MAKMKRSGKSRRSDEEIVDALIGALPVRNPITVEEIRRKAGLDWATAKRWLDLINYIQDQPRVVMSPRPSGRGEIYRRERKKREAKRDIPVV